MGSIISFAYGSSINSPRQTKYIGCKFNDETIQKVISWLAPLNIPNAVDGKELHVTLVSSSVDFPVCTSYPSSPACQGFPLSSSEQIVIDPSTYSFQVWDTKRGQGHKCFVLQVSNAGLEQRYKLAEQWGAKSIWPVFTAHMTISYSVPTNFNPASLPLPTFPLTVTHEFADYDGTRMTTLCG
jgi:hypothetical protein